MLYLLAQATTSSPPPSQPQSGLGGLTLLLPIVVLFYFLGIRPNQRRMRAQHELARSIAPGDEVETAGGILGIVRSAGDAELEVEVSPGVVMRFSRGAIRRKVIKVPGDPGTP